MVEAQTNEFVELTLDIGDPARRRPFYTDVLLFLACQLRFVGKWSRSCGTNDRRTHSRRLRIGFRYLRGRSEQETS
jgi:hypothetical protein